MTQKLPPAEAMRAFEQALRRGDPAFAPGAVDPSLVVRADTFDGVGRLAFARVDGDTVTAFVNFLECDPIDGVPCVNLGCAVPETHREAGRASEAIGAAIAELRQHYAARGVERFRIETFVREDNAASRRVAEKTLSPEATPVPDPHSGLPAFRYVRDVRTSDD